MSVMSHSSDPLRVQLARALDWEEAHVGFDQAVADMPADKRGAVPGGFAHSPWQLLEHLRIAQEDILDFSVNPNYVHELNWPEDYWPKSPAPPDPGAWDKSVASFKHDREKVKELTRQTKDLFAKVPTGKENHTYLRAILLLIDHNSHHLGQLVAVRRALGAWK